MHQVDSQTVKVIDRGTVFQDAAGTERQSCIFSGICVLPSGRWLCTFRAAPMKLPNFGHRTLVSWSDDEGKTWSEPADPFTPPSIEGRPGSFRLGYATALGGRNVLMVLGWQDISNPELPFFNEATEGLTDMQIFLARSTDDGATWSDLWMADTYVEIPTPITGPVLVLANGELACQLELNKHYYDEETEWRHSSVLSFSKDGGRSWPEIGIASNDPENRFFYWDQRPNVLAGGRILNLFWTYDNGLTKYLNVHCSESLDNGRTWSEPWETEAPGQPGPPVSLPDGSVLMVYVDRTDIPMIKARVSRDGGRTWPDATEILIYQLEAESQTWNKGSMQDTWAEMGKFSLGHPSTAALPNGDVLVVYYAGPESNTTGIHWVRLSP